MWKTILDNWGIVLVGTITLIQVAPIKINPWSSLLKWVSKTVNGDLVKKVDNIQTGLDSLERRFTDKEEADGIKDADESRRRILRFGDECRRNEKHSEEFFNEIFDDINAYHRYCEKHPSYKNSKCVLAIDRIEDSYKKCVKNNDFL